MAGTNIPFGSVLARKVYGAGVFAEMYRQPTLTNKLVGSIPKQSAAEIKAEKGQSSPDMPIVQVRDLSKGGGDVASIDLFNILVGKPIMGDEKIAGKLMDLTYDSQDIKLDQMRGGFDAGGRMTAQRTVHNLRSMGKKMLSGWWSRASEQCRLVHMAGARGGQNDPSWVIPTRNDADFGKIMVNSVNAPTYTRHLCVDGTDGDLVQGTAAYYTTNVANTDKMTLNSINIMRTICDESAAPLQDIRLAGDTSQGMEPLAMLLVTPRQWQELWHSTTSSNDWETFLRDARERAKSNPLFSGNNVGMWNGILVRKYMYPIRFDWNANLQVATSAADHTETTVTIKSAVIGNNGKAGSIDRAMLIGAQALAECWGKNSASGTHMNWYEREVAEDHGATFEASVSGIGGTSKITFKSKDGKDYDHGVYVIDSFVEGL